MTTSSDSNESTGHVLLGPLYKIQGAAQSRFATPALAMIAFVESLLPLPILTDPFLMAAVLFNRKKTIQLLIVTTLTSVVGGLAAYYTVVFFREPLLSFVSPELFETLNTLLASNDSTFALTLIGAVTPIPYTVVAWAVALSGGNPVVFTIAALLGRGVRYGIVGWCTYLFGPAALRYAKRSLLLTSAILFVFIALYIWGKM